MRELEQLLSLQELEKEKISLEARSRDLPQAAELRALKKEVEKAQALLEEMDATLKKSQKQMRQAEMDIGELKEKQKKISDLLYGGTLKSVKEMEGATEQLEEIKQKVSAKEDKLLDLMSAAEDHEKTLNDAKKEFKNLRERFRAIHSDYKKEQETTKARVNNLEQNIKQAQIEIDPKMISLYNELHVKFGPSVVARVVKNICSGCHMAISFELRKNLKSTGDILRCDKCGRLLVYQD